MDERRLSRRKAPGVGGFGGDDCIEVMTGEPLHQSSSPARNRSEARRDPVLVLHLLRRILVRIVHDPASAHLQGEAVRDEVVVMKVKDRRRVFFQCPPVYLTRRAEEPILTAFWCGHSFYLDSLNDFVVGVRNDVNHLMARRCQRSALLLEDARIAYAMRSGHVDDSRHAMDRCAGAGSVIEE